MLELNNFSNQFLDNVNFKAQKGRVTAIIGPNGSGKTTLAKYIAGIFEDYEGEIIINGKVSQQINQEVALLLQNPYHQFVGMDVFDEITYNLEQNNFSHQDINACLTQTNYKLDQTLLSLSGGEAQSLLITNYLYSYKDIFIFDETFSNLDAHLKTKMFELIKTQNKVIILITNNIYDLHFADRTYHLIDQDLVEQEIEIPKANATENMADISVTAHVAGKEYTFRHGFNLVMGPSGCGKSTLIKQLCGLQKADVQQNVTSDDYYYIGQYPFVQITNLVVKDLIGINEESLYLLTELGFMEGIYHRDIVSLSTGELVQIMLIHALLSKKTIICLDESIEVLDYKKQQLVLDICAQCSEQTFIFITHNPGIYGQYPVNEVMINARN